MKNLYLLLTLIVLVIVVFLSFVNKEEYTTISIGYQSITAQTWGAIVIKELNLIEKYLDNDKNIRLNWSNFASGPPITSNMIAGKVDIGFMGDMPLLINGDIGQNSKYYKSKLVMFDGKGIDGANQNIMVKNSSGINTISDLKGKNVSVPNSSSSHRNLLQELYLAGLDFSQVNIYFQDIPTGIVLLDKGEVDAISVWEPYPQYLSQESECRPLPKQDNIRYLAGVVVNEKWKSDNPEIYEAFKKSLIEAHNLLKEGSPEIVKIISEESGFSEDVVRVTIKNIMWDHEICADDIAALEQDIIFLRDNEKISDTFNLNEFVSEK